MQFVSLWLISSRRIKRRNLFRYVCLIGMFGNYPKTLHLPEVRIDVPCNANLIFQLKTPWNYDMRQLCFVCFAESTKCSADWEKMHHPGVWWNGQFTCCSQKAKHAPGCEPTYTETQTPNGTTFPRTGNWVLHIFAFADEPEKYLEMSKPQASASLQGGDYLIGVCSFQAPCSFLAPDATPSVPNISAKALPPLPKKLPPPPPESEIKFSVIVLFPFQKGEEGDLSLTQVLFYFCCSLLSLPFVLSRKSRQFTNERSVSAPTEQTNKVIEIGIISTPLVNYTNCI